MRRVRTAALTLAVTLLGTPAAVAHDQGQGWYGEANDKVVTNAGFLVIIAFPLIVLLLSLLQGRLEKRKDARKRAARARATSRRWQAGW